MLKHLGALTIARGLYTVSQAVLLVLLARAVGPQQFGIVASFLAAHTVLFWLAGMNTPTFVTREIALGEVGQAHMALRINAIVMAIALCAAVASCLLLAGHTLLLVAVAGNAVAIWSDRVSENRLAVSYGEKRIRTPVSTLVVRASVPVGLYLALVAIDMNALLAFAIARVAAGLASQALAFLMIRYTPQRSPVPARTLLRLQAPLAASQAAGAIRMLDSVIVIGIAGAAAAGIYAAVSRVVSPFTTLAVSAAPVLVPRAAHAPPDRVRRMLDVLLAAGIVLSAATLAFIPFVEPLVVLIFGAEFAGGGVVLFWVLLRVGPTVSAPLIANALQAKGHDSLVALNSAATSALTLAAVAIGAANNGVVGAAGGFAAVSLLGMIVLWLSGRRALSREHLLEVGPTAQSPPTTSNR